MMTRLVYSCTLGVLALGLSGCSFFTSFDEFEQQPDGSVDANVPDMTVDAGPQVDTPTEFYFEFASRLCAFVRRCEAKVPELRPIGQGYCLPPSLLTGLVPGEFAGTDLEGYSPLDALTLLAEIDAAGDTCALEDLISSVSFIGLFRGLLTSGSGEGCTSDRQCASGYCSASALQQCGVCESIPRLGDACSQTSDCPVGTLCDSNGTATCVEAPTAPQPCLDGNCRANSFCQAGTCIARPELNQACVRQGAGALSDPCASTLVCTRISAAPEEWRCESGRAAGMTCEDAVTPCAAGLRCVAGTCTAPLAEGASCTGDVCVLGLVCRAGTCDVPLTEGTQGCSASAPCLSGACAGGGCVTPSAAQRTACGFERPQPFSSAPPDYCADGYCDSSTVLCEPHKQDGDTCASSDECEPTSYCNQDTCSPRLPAAAPCADASDGCAVGLRCIGGLCAAPSGDGEACDDSDDCESGLVCVGPVGATTCSDCRP
jgi:hypothetical protein